MLQDEQSDCIFETCLAERNFDAAITDVVFLDIGMPEIDGYTVATQLRAEFSSRIGIVALSGWGDPESRAKSAKAGFDAHLQKPADLALIEATIAHLCGPRPKRLS